MPFITLNNTWSDLAQYYNQEKLPPSGKEFLNKPEIPSSQYSTFDDGLIRGGLTNVALSVTRDTLRIGAFFAGTDIKNITSIKDVGAGTNDVQGILFLTKQAGLQLTNPRLEWDRTNLVPPFLGGATRQFTGAGIIESVAGTAFGLHFDRAGLLGIIRDNQKYGGDIDNLTSGVTYKNNFGENGNNNTINPDAKNRLVRYLNKMIDLDESKNPSSVVLDRYFGGASSVYGIGYTTLKTNPDSRTIIRPNDISITPTYDTQFSNPATLTKDEVPLDILMEKTVSSLLSFGTKETLPTFDKSLPKIINTSTNPIFAKKLNGFIPSTNKQLADINPSIDYTSTTISPNIEVSNNLQFPGYDIESRFGVSTTKGPGSDSTKRYIDSINSINIIGSDIFYGKENTTISGVTNDDKIYKDVSIIRGDSKFGDDLIKFRLEFLNNEKLTTTVNNSTIVNTDILAFRAYLDDFSDGMGAKWNSYRYMGRGEEFYVYDGFTRDIGVSFTIHAHSEDEMAPLYNKLNYLMSTFTPDYSSNYKMRGNIGYLTVGDYLYRQPGIFTDIKIGGFMEGSWEIGLDELGVKNGQYQVPRMLKIQLSFKPIHTFLPRRNYRSTEASGKVGQVFQAPFITPDRNAYPIKEKNENGQEVKASNPYLNMDTNISKGTPPSSQKAATSSPSKKKTGSKKSKKKKK
jgi:hypothetical protein